MALFLTESDVDRLATMPMALEAVEHAFRLQGEGKADNAPRRRCRLDGGLLHVMSASLPTLGYAGLKSYSTVSGKARFHVFLYNAGDGQLLATLEANRLGQLRTGAASGIATRYMAREGVARLGIFGTGLQARSQLEGICAVRPVKTIVAYSRDAEKRKTFCAEMSEKLGIGVYPAAAPEEAAREMDVVVTATTAKEPVVRGEWLPAGVHVNAIGSNFLNKREVDEETVRRSACIIVDSLEQAKLESGELSEAAEAEKIYWDDVRELGAVVTGDFPGREDDSEVTLFKSHGIALEDVALAGKIYEAARAAGIGQKLPL
jgi:ornithine cyclodeaminase/alanine dehydrogenase-like protein (mu-crystallin family)